MVRGRLGRPAANQGKRVLAPEPPPNWDDYPPIFSFDHMVDSHCVDRLSETEKSDLTDAIWRRSKFTWRELRSSQRHGLGPEKIASVNVPIPAIVTEDVVLLAFRFSGKKPMVGFRDGRIFHVIWLDYQFNVYDH